MRNKLFILSMVCVLVLAAASIAEERIPVRNNAQKRFDRNRDGFIDEREQEPLHKFQEARGRIEELCVMAREHEENAKRLRAEAEELERELARGFEEMEMAEHIEKMHHKIVELKEAAERAEREGHHDEASELHKNAERIAGEIEANRREIEDRKLHEVDKRIGHLRRMAEEVEERGEKEHARELWAEAEELERSLKREIERREIGKHLEEMHHRVTELKEAAENAEREGHHDEAGELHEEARRLAMEIDETAHREKAHDMEREIEHLHALAREAKEAGKHDKAEAIFAEAEQMKRHLAERIEPQENREHKEGLESQIEMLRDEVHRLRDDIEKLENIIRQKVMNR